MAEWIKLRPDLLEHDTKVVIMMRELWGPERERDAVTLPNVTRAHDTYEVTVIAGLARVWARANRNIDDKDFVADVTLEDLDTIGKVYGFGRAMVAVGYAVEGDGGLYFPNFKEFNTPEKARSSAAERAKAYRDRKKENGPKRDDERTRAHAVTQTSAHENASVTPREEKRRVEENRYKNPPPPELRPHSPANASGHIEGKAAAELIELGVEHPVPAVQTAVRSGATLDDIRSLCHVFRSKPGAWKPNALQKRVSHFVPGQSPELGWPEVNPKWLLQQERGKRTEQAQQQARQREQERQDDQRVREDRERRYGPLLDDLSEQELRDLIRELIPEIAQKSHLDRLRRDGPDGYRKPGSYRRDLLQLWARSEEGNADAAA